MRRVTRSASPAILATNAPAWTAELLLELTNANTPREKSKVLRHDKVRARYGHDEVRSQLDDMYSGYCAYCESLISAASDEHVEHHKPKTAFPQLAYEWDNLHLACIKCNRSKGDKWDATVLFVDPSMEDPELLIGFNGPVAIGKDQGQRGFVSIDFVKLNRQPLITARGKAILNYQYQFADAWAELPAVRATNNAAVRIALINKLREWVIRLRAEFREQYGTCLKVALEGGLREFETALNAIPVAPI